MSCEKGRKNDNERMSFSWVERRRWREKDSRGDKRVKVSLGVDQQEERVL